jgi:hypothetical protein
MKKETKKIENHSHIIWTLNCKWCALNQIRLVESQNLIYIRQLSKLKGCDEATDQRTKYAITGH